MVFSLAVLSLLVQNLRENMQPSDVAPARSFRPLNPREAPQNKLKVHTDLTGMLPNMGPAKDHPGKQEGLNP